VDLWDRDVLIEKIEEAKQKVVFMNNLRKKLEYINEKAPPKDET